MKESNVRPAAAAGPAAATAASGMSALPPRTARGKVREAARARKGVEEVSPKGLPPHERKKLQERKERAAR